MIEFELNGTPVAFHGASDTPLLWAIRDHFRLKGSKFGCGARACAAPAPCTSMMWRFEPACSRWPVSPVSASQPLKRLTDNHELHPLQQAWVDHNVPQCGYCQSGQIMSAAALLSTTPNPSVADINNALAGNICRCGCYPRIKEAILSVAALTVTDETRAELAYDATAEAPSS